MQEYISQLLEDMATAHREATEDKQQDEPFSIEQHFEELEKWLAGEPEYTFAEHCGLQPEQFPPVERLTDEQLHSIYKAYGQLLHSWNLGVDIPESFPLSRAYPLLISTLHHKVEIVSDGFITIEFCSYDVPSCPFEEHCQCKQYQAESDEMTMHPGEQNDDIPF
jgi:hypothetical protein